MKVCAEHPLSAQKKRNTLELTFFYYLNNQAATCAYVKRGHLKGKGEEYELAVAPTLESLPLTLITVN